MTLTVHAPGAYPLQAMTQVLTMKAKLSLNLKLIRFAVTVGVITTLID
jgi:hypothetical protein